MRVGMFTYGMAENLTGIGRYAVELTCALRRVDPNIEIVLLNPYPESKLAWYRDFETYPVPSLKKLPAVMAIGSGVLAGAARRLKLDVLHDPCGIAPFLAPRFGVRRIVTVHDAIPRTLPHTQPLLTRIVFRTSLRAARWSADAILTVSTSARDDLVHHLGYRADSVHVTSNGVHYPSDDDLRRYRSRLPEVCERLGITAPYLFWVGGPNPRKNLGTLVRTFGELRQRGHDLCLVLAGPGLVDLGAVQAAMREFGTSVVVPGHVDDEALHVLYTGTAALVFPSLYEGFGLPVLEAMSHAAPVVASNRSSLPEIVGDAGLLVDPNDVPALADAVQQVVEDENVRGRLARGAREKSRQFTWERVASGCLEVYCAG